MRLTQIRDFLTVVECGGVRAAAAELRKAAEEASQTSQVGAGSVTFSMGPVGVIAILPEAMVRFRRQFPIARICVVEGYGHLMLPEVRSGVLDFAFGKSLRREWMHRSGFGRCSRANWWSAHAGGTRCVVQVR